MGVGYCTDHSIRQSDPFLHTNEYGVLELKRVIVRVGGGNQPLLLKLP